MKGLRWKEQKLRYRGDFPKMQPYVKNQNFVWKRQIVKIIVKILLSYLSYYSFLLHNYKIPILYFQLHQKA